MSGAVLSCINYNTKTMLGYQASVSGVSNESAYTLMSNSLMPNSLMSNINDENRYMFDQASRIKTLALASELKLAPMLSINFLPNPVYKPEQGIR